MSIHEKLTAIQTELKAPKNQYNSFGKYHYRSCEDILEALKPMLKKHEVSLYVTDDIELIGDRYYVKATVGLYDKDGGCIENHAYARESDDKKGMDSSQVTGATSSYARKYALNGLFLIDDTKDADTDEYHNQTNKKSAKSDEQANQQMVDSVDKDLVPSGKGMTEDRVKKLRAELKRTGNEESTILGFYKIKKIEDMKDEQYIACMNQLAKKDTKA